MFEIKISDIVDFEEIYKDMLLQFPKNELKDIEDFKRLLKNDSYRLLSVIDNDIKTGYAILYEDNKNLALWLDYIAVYRHFHSKGYGKKIFEALKSKYKDYKGIYLEVEKPDKKDINTVRRIKFYESLGARKLDIKYFYPNDIGCIEMDLYFLPLRNVSLPPKSETMSCIRSAFDALHSDLPHINSVYEKIN